MYIRDLYNQSHLTNRVNKLSPRTDFNIRDTCPAHQLLLQLSSDPRHALQLEALPAQQDI